MKHFEFSKRPTAKVSTLLKELLLPLFPVLLITVALVGLFVLCMHMGSDMSPVVPIHEDDGEMVDPNPMRLAFMVVGFVLAFVLAAVADRRGKAGRTMAAYLFGYAAGTLLWQSVGECAWHFSIVTDDYLMCFPHIEGGSALIMVIIACIFLVYSYRHHVFSWGLWIFVLSFVGNWFGHFVLIGSYPLVHTAMDETQWFRIAGLVIGLLVCCAALLMGCFSARTQKARLCCCLMLYFGIGIITTGVAGI